MKSLVNEIEMLLSKKQVKPPASLRSDVESIIEQNLRAQMRRDDLRWLAVSFGALLLSVGFSLVLISMASQSSRELTTQTLTDTNEGHRIAKILLSQKD